MKRWEQLALALLSLLSLWGAAAAADVDDALITYRYADNLAAGRGFSYNPGEWIWGTSTPLFTLVLAALAKLGLPPPLASRWLGAASAVLVVVLTALLARRLSGSRLAAWLAGLWCVVCAPLLVWASSGMETLSYTALLLGSFSAARGERAGLAAVLAGLAFLMRSDGLILLPALALYFLLLERRPLPFRALGLWLLVVLPWCLFALWRFSAVLPHSFAAKRAHPKLVEAGWFLRYFLPRHWWPSLGAAAVGWAQALVRPREPNGALVLSMGAWLALYAGAYSLAGLDYYEWYCIPPLPVLGLFAALGLEAVTRLASRSSAGGALALAAAGALLLTSLVRPRADYVRENREYVDAVEGTRRRIGEWLAQATPAEAVVMTGAVGQIGYFSRRRMQDHAQLVTLAAEAPADYVVAHDVPGGPPFGDEPFLREHALLAVFVPPAPHQALVYRVFRRLKRPRADPAALVIPAVGAPEPGMMAVGRLIDFADASVSASLGHGWAQPEPGFGTWALGHACTLRLGPALPLAARVTVELIPFAPPGARIQTVRAERRGVTLASLDLEPRAQEWTFLLPVAADRSAEDELTFRFDHSSSPREAGLSVDARPLAVAFQRLLLEPLADPAGVR